MSDPRDENIVPPADPTAGLTVRCPNDLCASIIAQAWRHKGQVYVMTAHLVTRCQPSVVPWVPASCLCNARTTTYRIDVAKVVGLVPGRSRRGVALGTVEVS